MLGQVFLKKPANASGRQPISEPIQKEGLFAGGLSHAKRNPTVDPGHRHRTGGAKAFATSLAAHPEKLLFVIDVVEVEANEFAHAEASAVERLEHGAVADFEGGLTADCVEKPDDIIHPKELGEPFRLLRVAKTSRGVGLHDPLATLKTVKRPQAGQPPRDRARGVASGVEPGDITAEPRGIGLSRVELGWIVGTKAFHLAKEDRELGKVVLIGAQRVGRRVSLRAQVMEKGGHGGMQGVTSSEPKGVEFVSTQTFLLSFRQNGSRFLNRVSDESSEEFSSHPLSIFRGRVILHVRRGAAASSPGS